MPGTLRVTRVRDLGIASQQRRDERVVAMAGARMHDETRRLVDDDDIGVFVDDRQFDRRVGLHGRHRVVELDHDLVAGAYPLRGLGHHDTTDAYVRAVDERLHARPAGLGEHGHDAIDAFVIERRRHDVAPRLNHRSRSVPSLRGDPSPASRRSRG